MPYKVYKDKTGYTVEAIDTGKKYHTDNPEKLEKLHEYFKNRGK